MNATSKLIAMIILGMMAFAGLFILVYDLCINQNTNIPTVVGFLVGIPVAWALGALGIHVGQATMQSMFQSKPDTFIASSTSSTTVDPVKTTV